MKKQSSCNGIEKSISNAGKTKLIAEVKTKTNIQRSLKARTKHCICFTKGQNGEKKKHFEQYQKQTSRLTEL